MEFPSLAVHRSTFYDALVKLNPCLQLSQQSAETETSLPGHETESAPSITYTISTA